MIPRTSPSIRSFHKGKIIFSEGQESKVAYMIKSGTVDIFRKIDRTKTVLATLRRGDIFGEMALLTDQKRTAYAEASSFCELVVLTEELMQKLLEASPATVKKMVELLAKRVVATDGKSSGAEESDSFISLATMLNLAYKEYAYTPNSQRCKIENYKMGLSVKSFTETVKGLTMFSNLEIESFLDSVYKLRLIDMNTRKKGDKNAFVERYIKIKNIEQFMPSLRNLYKQMKELGASVESRMSYMTFSDLAARTGTKPELIYKKVIKEEMPDNLLFLIERRLSSGVKIRMRVSLRNLNVPAKLLEIWKMPMTLYT